MRYRILLAAVSLTLGAWAEPVEKDDLTRDRKAIQGTWEVTGYDLDGRELPAEMRRKMSVTILADRITIKPKVIVQRTPALSEDRKKGEVKFALEEGKVDETGYQLDLVKKRKVLELTQDAGSGQVRKMTALYSLEEDRLTICIPLPERKLPKKIPDGPTAGQVRLVLKRAPPP